MIQYGDLIVQRLKSALSPGVHVQSNFPERWAQYSSAVFVLFNGYQILGDACESVHVATFWNVFITEKNAAAQTDKAVLESGADSTFRSVYNEIIGQVFDADQLKPAYLNDRITAPEYLPNVGIFPMGITIETLIK